jgi:aconitate hydratase
MSHGLFTSPQQLEYGSAACGNYYSLPALEEAGLGQVSRLPISLRIVLESVLRDYDGKKITETLSPRPCAYALCD